MKLDRLWPYLDEQPEEGAEIAGAEVPDDEAEPEVEVEAESSEEDEPEEEESEQSLLDLLKSEGVEAEASDDLTAAKFLIEQAKSAKAYQQKLEELEHARQYEAYLAAQRQQQATQQTAQAKSPYEVAGDSSVLKHWKQKPDFNPRWLSLVQRDDKGNLVPVSGADPTLPTKVAQYLEWQRDANELIASDPVRLVTEAMYANPEISAAINAMIENRLGQAMAELKAERIVDKSATELFETDANGKLIQKNGQYVPNQLGKTYQRFAHQLAQDGITDPERQHQMALLMAKGALGQSAKPAKAKEDSTESRAEKRFQWQKKSAAKSPKRSGSPSGSANGVIESANELERELLRQLTAAN